LQNAPATDLSNQWVILVGTLVVTILVVFIFLFLLLYQRRVLRYQADLQRLESEKQQALTRAVLETQEGERRRLAEDLHDSVGQVLSAVKMNMSRLEKQQSRLPSPPDEAYQEMFGATQAMVNDSIGEIRNIIRNILPPVLRDFGLVEAVRDLCGKIQHSTGIGVQFSYDGEPFRAKPESEVMLYRVVQELFNNALKHAKATELTVSLVRRGDQLTLTFADNGVGFDPARATNGLGLRGMESRIQLLKGELVVDSQPGHGTRTTLRVGL
jgi:signal transduction histidine kinase